MNVRYVAGTHYRQSKLIWLLTFVISAQRAEHRAERTECYLIKNCLYGRLRLYDYSSGNIRKASVPENYRYYSVFFLYSEN